MNGTYRHSPEHDFLPRHDGRLELFQGFGSGFEGSLNARFMNFDAVDVDIYGLSLGRYWNDWYVRGNLSRSQDTRNSQGTFGQLTVRNYYRVNNDDYWEGSVGLGKDQVNVGPTRQSLTQTTESFTLLWHRYWTRKWGTELSYRYTGPDRSATRQRVSVLVLRRWY